MNADKMNVFYLLTSAAALASGPPASAAASTSTTPSTSSDSSENITQSNDLSSNTDTLPLKTEQPLPSTTMAAPLASSPSSLATIDATGTPASSTTTNLGAAGPTKESLVPLSSLLALSNAISQQPPQPALPVSSAADLASQQQRFTSAAAQPSSKQDVVAWFKGDNFVRRRGTAWKTNVPAPGGAYFPAPASAAVPNQIPLSSNIGLAELSKVSTSRQAAAMAQEVTYGDDISPQTVIPIPNRKGQNNTSKKKRRKAVGEDDTDSDSDYGDSSDGNLPSSPLSDSSFTSGDVEDPRLRDAYRTIENLKLKLKNLKLKCKTLQEQQAKGKREIRNANACEAHKRRHQKCPDNCPGRLALMAASTPANGASLTPTSPLPVQPKKRGKSASPVMMQMGQPQQA